MFDWLRRLRRELRQAIAAKRRHERRVAPRGVRGRVYESKIPGKSVLGAKKGLNPSGGNIQRARAKPKVTISARVIRKDGSIEEHQGR